MIKSLAFRLSKAYRSPFARNWSFLVLSNIGCQILGLIATLRIARMLQPAGYGSYNLVQVTASVGLVIAGLGLRNVIVRECARAPDRTGVIFSEGAALRAAMVGIVGIGVCIYGQLANTRMGLLLTAIAVALMVGLATWDLAESVTFGHEQMKLSSVINLLGSGLWAMLIWAVPASLLTVYTISGAFAMLQIVKAIALLLAARRAGLLGTRPSSIAHASTMRWLLGQSLPFYWLALLTALTNQVPVLLLAERSGHAAVGLYNAGFRLVNPIQMLIMTALTAMYPGLSRSAVADAGSFAQTVQRAFVSIAVLGSAAATAVSLVRSEVVTAIYGSDYLQAADAMSFQVWYTLLLGIYSLIGTMLAAKDKQRWLAWLSTAYAVVAVPILWVGAGFGARGLAIASVVAAVLNFPYHWLLFRKVLARSMVRQLAVAIAVFAGGLGISFGFGRAMVLPARIGLGVLVLVGAGLWWARYSGVANRRDATTAGSAQSDLR